MKTILKNLDSGWITLNSLVKYRKVNDIVYFVYANQGSQTLTAKAYTTVGTLPTGYRPNFEYPFSFDFVGDNSISGSAFVSTAGEIKIYVPYALTYIRAVGSFPVD